MVRTGGIKTLIQSDPCCCLRALLPDSAELGNTSAALSRAAGALAWGTTATQEHPLGVCLPGKHQISAAAAACNSGQAP